MLDLAKLVSPTEVCVFKRDHWEQRPLLVPRSDRDYFAELLTLEDVDHILSLSSVHHPVMRVVRDGSTIPFDKLRGQGRYGHLNLLDSVYEELKSGATIILQSLEERWHP